MPNRAGILKQQFTQSIALPWAELLPEERVDEMLAEEAVSYYNSRPLEKVFQ